MNESVKFGGNMGLVCDFSYSQSICIRNYYYAIHNLFPSVTMVSSASDLKNVDFVFIGNDHFIPHVSVWRNNEFINYCNEHNKPVFVHTAETIYNDAHPWNVDIQRSLESFKTLHQWCYDVNDCVRLKKEVARCCISRHYARNTPTEKKDKCVFVGTVYPERRKLIDALSKVIELEVIPNRSLPTYEDYFNLLAQYRFILSPHSIGGNSFTSRFYEALLVGSIPVHQVYPNTLSYYTEEASFEDAVFFESAEELPQKLLECKLMQSYNRPWLEDVLAKNFLERGLTTL